MASAAITLPSKLTTPPAGTNVKIFVVNPNTGAGLLQGASFSRRENEGFGAPTTINPDGTLYYTFGAGSWYFDLALPNDGGMNREQFHVVVASNGTVTVSNSTLDPNGYFIVVASRLPAPSSSHPPGQPWTLPNGYQTWADKPTVNYLLPIFQKCSSDADIGCIESVFATGSDGVKVAGVLTGRTQPMQGMVNGTADMTGLMQEWDFPGKKFENGNGHVRFSGYLWKKGMIICWPEGYCDDRREMISLSALAGGLDGNYQFKSSVKFEVNLRMEDTVHPLFTTANSTSRQLPRYQFAQEHNELRLHLLL